VTKRLVLRCVDDLDGSPAAARHTLELDGQRVTLDLSKENATRLHELIAPYLAAGSPAPLLAPSPMPPARQSSGNDAYLAAGSPAAPRQGPLGLRTWARANEIALPRHGRVPDEILAQWRAAVTGA
jgi:hypothetical protein